ncbi:hypothetical protein BDW02DRAFT_168260 [Decorospora gaudefroyi]|uniref:Uncharacterized protein n=1 Tax=Decorospora gaudefroyi TaxID=184978 RepID=A0A6A5K3Z3_9PLEO|nr:hypothetical protein BDW02DRAFT_168260 [Decorospora gaudefroyi]
MTSGFFLQVCSVWGRLETCARLSSERKVCCVVRYRCRPSKQKRRSYDISHCGGRRREPWSRRYGEIRPQGRVSNQEALSGLQQSY